MSSRLARDGYTFKKCVSCGRRVPDKVCPGCGSRRFSWAYRVDTAPRGAERRQKTRSGFKSEGDARAELRALLGEQRSGVWTRDSETTLGEFISNWIETANLKPTTRAGYEAHIRNYIIPALGDYRLRDLDKQTIKRFYLSLAEPGTSRTTGARLADRTIHRVHNTLHSALESAVEDNLLPKNPANRAHSEPPPNDVSGVWTADELAKFLRSVEDDRWYPMWRLFAMTGMRRAEVAGLKWSEVDLAAKTLTVKLTRTRVKGRIVEDRPKTKRSRRTIDLDDVTIDALLSWQASQIAERVELGEAYQDDGWVFCWEDGTPLEPTGISTRFSRRIANTGVPRIRLHDLRHTHATLLLRAGVAPHVVSQRLGHEKVSFTLEVYGHVMPGQQWEAAARFAALVDG